MQIWWFSLLASHFLSPLLPWFHTSALFILHPCLSHFFSFHHCLIHHSQPLFPCSLLLPLHFSLSNYFHKSVWHDRGGCKRRMWQMQMSVWQGVVQDCSFTHCTPPNMQVCHALSIDLIVGVHFDMCGMHQWVPFRVYLRMKYFSIEGFHINTANKVVCRCCVWNGSANFHVDLTKDE